MASQMKLGREGQAYGSAAFAFPDNPRTFDIPSNPNKKTVGIPMGRLHIGVDYGGTDPKAIVLNGEFRGSTRRDDYRSLVQLMNEASLLKLFLDDEYFYYCLGQDVKETNSGTRTNFIDYVATLWSPWPYALSTTEDTYTVSIDDTSAHTLNDATASTESGISADSTGAFTNAGTAPAYVELEVENTGTNDITQVEFGDRAVSSGSVDGDRLTTWTGTLQSGETLTISTIAYISQAGGGNVLRWARADIDGTQSGNVKLSNSLLGITAVRPGTTDQDFSIKLTGNNGADVTARYREAERA